MSDQSAKDLLKRMATDGDFASTVQSKAQSDPQAAFDYLKSNGYNVTKAEVEQVASQLTAGNKELSEADLENVAGGSTVEWIAALATVVGAAAAAAAA